jgi:hypothetical protein
MGLVAKPTRSVAPSGRAGISVLITFDSLSADFLESQTKYAWQ